MVNKDTLLHAIQMVSNAQTYYDLLEKFAKEKYEKHIGSKINSSRYEYVEYEIINPNTIKIHVRYYMGGDWNDDFFIVTIQEDGEQ